MHTEPPPPRHLSFVPHGERDKLACVCLCAAQESMLVVFAEELREDRQRVMDSITTFLGLPSFDVSAYGHDAVKRM